MGLKRSIFGKILPTFAVVFRPLKQKPDLSALLSLNSPNRLCFRHSDGGYVLILVLTIIPVLLFGAKLVLDQQTANKVKLENGEVVYGGATTNCPAPL